MLMAHLDTTNDAASRNSKVINKTVNWISQNIKDNSSIMDLGCGPGLYAEQLCSKGYHVTGIDISKRSIKYAIKSAIKKNLNIRYIHQNYIKKRIKGNYDAAICIYCDFGALTPSEQVIFLKRVHNSLNTNGILFFDVFTKGLSTTKKETKLWNSFNNGSFWSNKAHFLLEEVLHFPEENTWGHRSIVITKGKTKEYITWDTYYSQEQIIELLKNNGFKVEEIKDDIVEKNDFTSDEVMFIKAKKI
jgi:SAM-dependent methyltransferase